MSALTAWTQADLDEDYLALIGEHGGTFLNACVRLYGLDEVIERNETFETKTYCPEFLTIGDDSGGLAVVIQIGTSPSPVYVVDQGSMSESDFEMVAPAVKTWSASGYPTESKAWPSQPNE